LFCALIVNRNISGSDAVMSLVEVYLDRLSDVEWPSHERRSRVVWVRTPES
jgi:hypothetical protein